MHKVFKFVHRKGSAEVPSKNSKNIDRFSHILFFMKTRKFVKNRPISLLGVEFALKFQNFINGFRLVFKVFKKNLKKKFKQGLKKMKNRLRLCKTK